MSTFAQAMVNDIEVNWATPGCHTIYWGIPQQKSGEFVVALIVTPQERPQALCENQGEAGQLDMQFSGVAASSQEAYNLLENLKGYVKDIAGQLVLNTNTFQVNGNWTEGVRQLDAALNTWDAIFESRIMWHEV